MAKQASQFLGCNAMTRTIISFGNLQLVLHAPGTVDTGGGNPPRELLLVVPAGE